MSDCRGNGMQKANFPLVPFLLELHSLELRICIDDLVKIHSVLRTRHQWTRIEIRNALTALLAKTKEQQTAFVDFFNEYFGMRSEEAAAEEDARPVDLSVALSQLKGLVAEAPRPLVPFLRKLPSRGFPLDLDDLERIQSVLESRPEWTLTEIRDELSALLSETKERQSVFVDLFNDYFQVGENDDCLLDLPLALSQLKDLVEEWKSKPFPPPPPPKPGIWKSKLMPGVLCVVLLAINIWLAIPPGGPELCHSPPLVDFKHRPINEECTEVLSLQNCGNEPLEILGVEHAEDAFRFEPDFSDLSLGPGETLAVQVIFRPGAKRYYFSELVLRHNGRAGERRIVIKGLGVDKEDPPPPPTKTPRMRRYPRTAVASEAKVVPPVPDVRWRRPFFISVVLLLSILFHRWYVHRRKRDERDCPHRCDASGAGRFRLGSVGGDPEPCLNRAQVDEIAETLGYHESHFPSRDLNIDASLLATLENGCVPVLVHQRRKLVRELIVLEDEDAEACVWNPIAAELARSLPARGIPVVYGTFRSSPLDFRGAEGRSRNLEDFDENPAGQVVLIFTDGKHLGNVSKIGAPPAIERVRILEALARMPQLAWLDLREPRAWDESLPLRCGIPVYPATPDGVLDALRFYLSESLVEPATPDIALSDEDLPPAAALERHLGDALEWAQDCALIHPVLPLGLAEALRREFHPDLPREAIGRLHTAPGTVRTAAGLRFSDATRKILLELSFDHRDKEARNQVRQFILDRLEEERPDGEDNSLAVLAWILAKEKIRFEKEKDYDCQQLACLEKTPELRPAVHQWLDEYRDADIPLEKPENPEAVRRMAHFENNPLDIPRKRSPVFSVNTAITGLLLVSCLFFGWRGYALWMESLHPAIHWKVVHDREDPVEGAALAWLEKEGVDGWEAPETLSDFHSFGEPIQVGETYRFRVFDNGIATTAGPTLVMDTAHYHAVPQYEDVELPCRQDLGQGLFVVRCSAEDSGDQASGKQALVEHTAWRDLAGPDSNRVSSLGLVVTNSPEDAVSQEESLLLKTGSVDAVYRVETGPDEGSLEKPLDALTAELGPLLARTQLVWWAKGDGADLLKIADVLSKRLKTAEKALLLENWSQNFQGGNPETREILLGKLLAPGQNERVSEDEILDAFGAGASAVFGEGGPVVLFRPLAAYGVLLVETNVEADLVLRKDAETLEKKSNIPIPQLAPGRWTVTASAPGYETSSPEMAQIVAGGTVRLAIELKPPVPPEYASLAVTTDPEGATLRLYRDGEPEVAGKGGDTFTLAPGAWKIEATAEHRETVVVDVKLRSGEIAKKSLFLPHREYSLTVNPTPTDARVRIMNIQQVYEDGILLWAGRYDIEVSALGFDAMREWIDLKNDLVLKVDLNDPDPHLIEENRSLDSIFDLLTKGDRTQKKPTSNFAIERSWKAHDGAICNYTNCLAFSPDGKKLLSGSADHTVKLWDLTKDNEAVSLRSHQSIVNSVAISPDGKWLASCSWDDTVQISSASDGRLMETLDVASSGFYSAAFSPDGKWLASGSYGPNAVHVCSTKDWQLKHTLSGHKKFVNCVRFRPDGQVLASGSDDNTVKLWSIPDGKLLHTLKGHVDDVNGLAFTPDGKTLLSGSSDATVKLWDPDKGRLLRTYEMRKAWGSALAVSPDGLLLAWGTEDGEIDLARISDGQVMQTLAWHADQVRSVAFSPDGRYLASADKGGVIKLWWRQASPISTGESKSR